MKAAKSAGRPSPAAVVGTPTRTKVLILDDHPVFREGLAQLISSEPDMLVCGQARTAAEALKAVPRLKPDLALIDLQLPDQSGLEVIKKLRAAGSKVKLLVVSMHDEAVYANRVLRLGADGYIMKSEDASEIIEAVRDVVNGHLYLSEAILAAMHGRSQRPRPEKKPENPLDRLTDHELEILERLGRGLSNEEIAKDLNCAPQEIVAGGNAIKKKLGVKTDNALVRYAVCWIESGRV
jgi:DNA-binding NarL/FixJ family response regulator